MSNSKEKQHMSIVASLGCVLCRRDAGSRVVPEVHHIAEGTGKRSDFMTAGLCEPHHRGSIGIHGAGVKKFLMMYGLSTEYHLLQLVNQYRAEDKV